MAEVHYKVIFKHVDKRCTQVVTLLVFRSCVGVCSSSEFITWIRTQEWWISLRAKSDYHAFLCSHRRSRLPSGSWSNRTPPPLQPRRLRPCRAPPLRSWIRRRSFLKRRQWMRSERRCWSLDRDVFRFPSNRNRISVAPTKPFHPPTHPCGSSGFMVPKQREFCLVPLVVKEATVFINSNRAYINGNIQYIIRTYI